MADDVIESIFLQTAAGCMGESRWFKVDIGKTGAFCYHGFRNVEHLGEHVGSVNRLGLEHIFTVMISIGIEPALNKIETDVLATTGGEWSVMVRTADHQYDFAYNSFEMPSAFWCVWRLIELLLANATWGQDAFDNALATKNEEFTDSQIDLRTSIPPLGPGTGDRYF